MDAGEQGRDRDAEPAPDTSSQPRPTAPDQGGDRTEPTLRRGGDGPAAPAGLTPPERVPWSPDPVAARPVPVPPSTPEAGDDDGWGRPAPGTGTDPSDEDATRPATPRYPAPTGAPAPPAGPADTDDEITDMLPLAVDPPPAPRAAGTEVLPLPGDPDPGAAAPVEEPPPAERIVRALADGPTLRDVATGAPIRVGEVARIGSELATVLAHLHHRGLAHGAVSPANVVLAPGGQPQLVDVGEVAGARPADDVHDLGLVLLTALNGTDSGVVPTDVPRTLRRVLLAATDADPARRPTARQVVDMLAWVARDNPGAAPAARTPGRPAAWVFAVGALLVVLLGLGTVALLRENPPPAEPVPTVAPTPEPTPVAPEPTPVAPEPSPVAPTETPVLPTAIPELPTSLPTALPTSLPTALPTSLPTALPTSLPTALPDIGLPTALPELPDVPDLPSEADGLWDRFVEWVKSLF